MFLEFHEPISVDTPIGKGRALFVERTAHDYFWTVALSETCAIVTFAQNKLRICRSYTHERALGDEEMRRIIERCGAPANILRAKKRPPPKERP